MRLERGLLSGSRVTMLVNIDEKSKISAQLHDGNNSRVHEGNNMCTIHLYIVTCISSRCGVAWVWSYSLAYKSKYMEIYFAGFLAIDI